jgi:hypothetical protein
MYVNIDTLFGREIQTSQPEFHAIRLCHFCWNDWLKTDIRRKNGASIVMEFTCGSLHKA